MELSSQAVVRKYPIPAFSGRTGKSDLGRLVPGRRDDGQDRYCPERICARTCGPIHLQSSAKHRHRPTPRQFVVDESRDVGVNGSRRLGWVGRGLAHHPADIAWLETSARRQSGTSGARDYLAPSDPRYRALADHLVDWPLVAKVPGMLESRALKHDIAYALKAQCRKCWSKAQALSSSTRLLTRKSI